MAGLPGSVCEAVPTPARGWQHMLRDREFLLHRAPDAFCPPCVVIIPEHVCSWDLLVPCIHGALYSVMQCSAVQYSMVRCGALLCSMVWCGAVQCSVVKLL